MHSLLSPSLTSSTTVTNHYCLLISQNTRRSTKSLRRQHCIKSSYSTSSASSTSSLSCEEPPTPSSLRVHLRLDEDTGLYALEPFDIRTPTSAACSTTSKRHTPRRRNTTLQRTQSQTIYQSYGGVTMRSPYSEDYKENRFMSQASNPNLHLTRPKSIAMPDDLDYRCLSIVSNPTYETHTLFIYLTLV